MGGDSHISICLFNILSPQYFCISIYNYIKKKLELLLASLTFALSGGPVTGVIHFVALLHAAEDEDQGTADHDDTNDDPAALIGALLVLRRLGGRRSGRGHVSSRRHGGDNGLVGGGAGLAAEDAEAASDGKASGGDGGDDDGPEGARAEAATPLVEVVTLFGGSAPIPVGLQVRRGDVVLNEP